MPLLFNQSAPPKKKSFSGQFPPQIMSLAISGYLHRQTNPPLSPSLICSTTRLESPQTGTIYFRMGIAWTSPANHPPEISSRPCMAYLINIRVETAIDQDRQPFLAFITMSRAKPNVRILRTLLKNTKNISINYLFEYIPNHKIGGDSDGCRLKIFFPFSLLFQFEKKKEENHQML